MKLAVDQIETTAGTQVRVNIDPKIVDEYAKSIKAGAIFPPLTVYSPRNSQRFLLSDGFHRILAFKKLNRKTVSVDICEGGKTDALMFALGANADHGLRRSNADKVNAVKLALKDPEISQLTQQEIADICRVDRKTVNRTRLRETLDENEQKGVPKVQQPEENTPANIRPTKVPPTQAEIERKELRQAMSLIKAFPYGGGDTEKLGLTQDDIVYVKYCIQWLTEALEAHVAAHYEPDDLRDSENFMATGQ